MPLESAAERSALKLWRRLCRLCLFLLLAVATNGWAGVLNLRDDGAPQVVDSFDLRHDLGGRLDIASVAAAPDEFVAAGAGDLTRGFDPRPVWLRLTLRNPGPSPVLRWLEIGHARLESVQLFDQDGRGGWQAQASGLQIPMASRPVPGASALFPLRLEAGESRTIFLRAQSRTALYLGATLWDPLDYRSFQLRNENLWSMALGGILLSGLLALLIFVQLRETPYLYFGLEMLFVCGFEAAMGGLLQQYLWPAQLPFTTGLIALLSAAAVIMHCQFVRTFLDLKRLSPGWGRALQAVGLVAAIAALGANVHNYSLWIQGIAFGSVAAALIGVITSYLAWRRGNAAARLTLISFSGVGLATIVYQTGFYRASELAAPAGVGILPWAILIMAPLILLAITVRTQQLAAALVLERETNRAKTTFLAHMSHELRTPLNTIIGFAQLLQRGSRRLSLEEGARAIEGSGRHLLNLIDELLDAARAEIGQLQIDNAPVAFRPWLADMVEVARLQAEQAGNSFSLEEHGTVPEFLNLDGRRLRQVLDNLFSNANRHTRAGCISLRYQGERQAGQARLTFEVADSGGGIAADDLPHIFEPFVRGRDQGGQEPRPGIGLGLAIARQLVQHMGGELTVTSTQGEGSLFRFHVLADILPGLPVLSETDQSGPALPGYGGRTVLLVEDEVDQRLLLAEQLAHHQLVVLTAGSGREAAASWRDDIALVITDQFMADGDGWSVLRLAAERAPAVPVVLVSAADPLPPEGFPPQLRFAASLHKPVDQTDLAMLLERFLGLHGLLTDAPPTASAVSTAPPSPALLQELASLVESGQVTRIEAWAQALAHDQPHCAGFADNVLQAALMLDFQRLAELAMPLSDDCPVD